MNEMEYIRVKRDLKEVIQKLRNPLNKGDRFKLECRQMQLEMNLSLIVKPYSK